MTKNKESKTCCKLEAVVSFDDRGQLVLPKDIRKKFNLSSGDKFAIISCMDNDNLCCLTLVKTDSLNSTMQDFLRPAIAML